MFAIKRLGWLCCLLGGLPQVAGAQTPFFTAYFNQPSRFSGRVQGDQQLRQHFTRAIESAVSSQSQVKVALEGAPNREITNTLIRIQRKVRQLHVVLRSAQTKSKNLTRLRNTLGSRLKICRGPCVGSGKSWNRFALIRTPKNSGRQRATYEVIFTSDDFSEEAKGSAHTFSHLLQVRDSRSLFGRFFRHWKELWKKNKDDPFKMDHWKPVKPSDDDILTENNQPKRKKKRRRLPPLYDRQGLRMVSFPSACEDPFFDSLYNTDCSRAGKIHGVLPGLNGDRGKRLIRRLGDMARQGCEVSLILPDRPAIKKWVKEIYESRFSATYLKRGKGASLKVSTHFLLVDAPLIVGGREKRGPHVLLQDQGLDSIQSESGAFLSLASSALYAPFLGFWQKIKGAFGDEKKPALPLASQKATRKSAQPKASPKAQSSAKPLAQQSAGPSGKPAPSAPAKIAQNKASQPKAKPSKRPPPPPPPSRIELVFDQPRVQGTRVEGDDKIRGRLIRLFNEALPGSNVWIAVWKFDDANIARAMGQALGRGVKIQVITSHVAYKYIDKIKTKKLRDLLPKLNISTCQSGCLSNGKLHGKFYLFEKIPDGRSKKGHSSVVVQTSANFVSDQKNMFNDMTLVYADPILFDGYLRYWKAIQAKRKQKNYHCSADGWVFGASTLNLQTHFYPTSCPDPILKILSDLKCRPGDEIKVAQNKMREARGMELISTLRRLKKRGCKVEVLTGANDLSKGLAQKMARKGVPTFRFAENKERLDLHSAFFLIRAQANLGQGLRPQSMVITMTGNMKSESLVDEGMALVIPDPSIYNQYLRFWETAKKQAEPLL